MRKTQKFILTIILFNIFIAFYSCGFENWEKLFEKTSWDNSLKNIDMVWISSGSFYMNDLIDESNHQVTLSRGFYISKYPVTQAQYKYVMGTNPAFFTTSYFPYNFKTNPYNHPVEQVSWYDAVEFCNKLSEMEGLPPAYIIDKNTEDENNTHSYDTLKWTVTINPESAAYRLPTEAEWEYACLSGMSTEDYSGSINYNETGWYSANSDNRTHEVGKKSANTWNLCEMCGNVWEWCWDWYDEYDRSFETRTLPSSSGNQDPAGPSSGAYRVRRGGAWNSEEQCLNPVYRENYLPSYSNYSIGFRVLCF